MYHGCVNQRDWPLQKLNCAHACIDRYTHTNIAAYCREATLIENTLAHTHTHTYIYTHTIRCQAKLLSAEERLRIKEKEDKMEYDQAKEALGRWLRKSNSESS
jgi:hypothetical protein